MNKIYFFTYLCVSFWNHLFVLTAYDNIKGKENKKNVRILKTQKIHNNMINDKLDNVIDYEEINNIVKADEGQEEETSNKSKTDEEVTNELRAKENGTKYDANEVQVSRKSPSKSQAWIDQWTGCKCGKGIPGERNQQKNKKKILKIASGYGPNR